MTSILWILIIGGLLYFLFRGSFRGSGGGMMGGCCGGGGHGGHDHSGGQRRTRDSTMRPSEKATTVEAYVDSVCGMAVEKSPAVDTLDFEGQTYYFCSSDCKEKFVTNPKRYLQTPAAKSRGGCCG